MFDRVLIQRPRGFKILEVIGKWQLVSEIIQHKFIFIEMILYSQSLSVQGI